MCWSRRRASGCSRARLRWISLKQLITLAPVYYLSAFVSAGRLRASCRRSSRQGPREPPPPSLHPALPGAGSGLLRTSRALCEAAARRWILAPACKARGAHLHPRGGPIFRQVFDSRAQEPAPAGGERCWKCRSRAGDGWCRQQHDHVLQ